MAASSLYSRNLLTFLTTFWDKDSEGAEAAARRRHRERRDADPRRRRGAPGFPASSRQPEPCTERHAMNLHPSGRLKRSASRRRRRPGRPCSDPGGIEAAAARAVVPFVFLFAIFLMACSSATTSSGTSPRRCTRR